MLISDKIFSSRIKFSPVWFLVLNPKLSAGKTGTDGFGRSDEGIEP